MPPVTCHNLDPHSGFPFLPHMAAYLVSELKKYAKVDVIDALSSGYNNFYKKEEFLFIGLSPEEILRRVKKDTDIIFIYIRTVIDYEICIKIIKLLKKNNFNNIVVFENSQCVDGLALVEVHKEFLNNNADMVIFGEPENKVKEILDLINGKKIHINGIAHKYFNKLYVNFEKQFVENLDQIDFPDWESWDLNGYWKLGFSHPPTFPEDRFVSLITSRGCPFRCTFCVAPETNPNWRYRSPENVVAEIEYFNNKLGINDFHISDLNPTVREDRFVKISQLIIQKNLKIKWKVAQGTKIETIKNYDNFQLFYKSGCRFISFSPESGSPRVMRDIINKSFKHEVVLEQAKHLVKSKINSQACFVIGMPGENLKDLMMSYIYMIKLALKGIDEVSCYIITPVPGSKLFGQIKGYTSLSQCSHTPTWRKDIIQLLSFRFLFYMTFILIKVLFHPIEAMRVFLSFFNKKFKTKMEMSIIKKIKLKRFNLIAKKIEI